MATPTLAAVGVSVDVATVARIGRGGCMIRAGLLRQTSDEYAAGGLAALLVASTARAPSTRGGPRAARKSRCPDP